MSDFQLYFTLGLHHVLSFDGYDHILFLAMLALPYSFKEWRQVLLLATLFTVGHTMSLVLSVYDVVSVNSGPVEFLISLTIFVTALFNIFKPKSASGGFNAIALITLFFGIVHGLGFSHGFKMLVAGNKENTFLSLIEFTLGIEAAQLIAVLGVVLISMVATQGLKVNRRDWLLVVSAFVAGISLPLIIGNRFW
ncbi:HupE/UreJ family protein [Flavobacterium psychrotrophum]|uniref:HupE/UreJ family protein n=1 Tax=Flavobacterium psychrotrophum TaxID=2294119 RepID=UPI000E32289B|nr:HupE/UreJ family protein [Flavobacterium psychrotrophum]